MKSSSLFISTTLIFGVSLSSCSSYTPGTEALYYGFFFDSGVASSIKNIKDTYFSTCLEKIPDFKGFMESLLPNSNISDVNSYFVKPLDPNTQKLDAEYHVTAKYCGDADCSQYRNMVEPVINKKFEMHLIGYYVTNRTFGVRVKLTPEQEQLFDSEENTLDFNFRSKAILPGIRLENTSLDFSPTNTKPHVTLGCAPGVPAVTTGSDLLEIISYEKNRTEFGVGLFYLDLDGGTALKGTNATVVHYLGQYGDAFVIYPSVKVVATATFKPYLKSVTSSASGIFFIKGLITSIISLLMNNI